jgi:branched-chain amino acid transport system ATP-binding protein
MTVALQISGLTVRHGAVVAVQDAALSVPAGAITGLVGVNGAGKSSLRRAVVGLAAADGGIRLGDLELSGLSVEARIGAGLAYVPEGRRVFPGMTVEENLLVAGPDNAHRRRERLAQALDLFPQLAPRRADRAWQLSGGQQQMLAIGRALMTNPRLLILDEATEGLAPLIRTEIWNCLAGLKAARQSILVIDKNVEALTKIADRHHIVEKGRVVWTGSSDELRADAELQARYLGV